MDPETLRQVVLAFSAAHKGLRLYPLQHPAIEKQVQALFSALTTLFRHGKLVRVGLLEGALFVEDYLFAEESPAADEIVGILNNCEIQGLEFHLGTTLDELRALLKLIYQGTPKGEAFETSIRKAGCHHICIFTVRKTEENLDEAPRQVYGRALRVVDRIFQDVRMGKIPSSAEAMEVVRSMVQLTLAEPHALFALSMLKDYDNYTFTHSVNVSVIALAVGRACGLSEEQLRTLGLGGLLHDLGKLKIDLGIINKPGRLTDEEFEQIKTHPRTGADLVKEMEGVTPEVIDIVLGHHLRYDREGYPADAKGHEVSPLIDMAAIADTYDAITTLRSYQRPSTPRKAVTRLREVVAAGGLHPQFVEQFIASLGTYPVGSLVRLDSSEIGLVVWVDTKDPDSVRIKILIDPNGTLLAESRRIDLQGTDSRRIIAEVDPFTKGIEVTDYLD
ncbi:MAG TPA: HD domain-containing phosphohydrolase [Desulfuromonadales bacterium]|nr:HD domain-containing phosphohydrolase [Desulfuromonadales bacterium]